MISMNKIKIMHIISDSNFGGAGKYLLEICKYIDKNKFQLFVVLPKESIIIRHIEKIQEIEIIGTHGIEEKSFHPKGVRNLLQIMKRIRPDIVHTHGCLSARVAANIIGIKSTIYTRHSLTDKSNGLKQLIKVFVNKILNDKVIAVSKAVYNNLIEEGVKTKNMYLVYNGIELPEKSYDIQSLKSKYGLSNKDIIITLVGRLEPVKGQDHILNIGEKLKAQKDNFQILLVGEGSSRSILETNIGEKNLPVRLLGHIEDVDQIYYLSDIIVNTSNSEALSFAALEGFSHKKPVVAFNNPGINEVINNNIDGYLVKFKDYDEFVYKLIRLMEDVNLRKKFGEAGYDKVSKKFTAKNMVKKIENIYGDII